MKAQDFVNISIRGRMAFAIICLENAIKHFKLDETQWIFIYKMLWRYTNTNVGKWHEQMAECTPNGVLNSTDDLSDLEFLNETEFWEINKLYQKTNKIILRIIDVIFYIGIKDLYTSITNGSQETLKYIQEIIDLLNNNNIALPNIKLFNQFPISENNGWGREFERADIFKKE